MRKSDRGLALVLASVMTIALLTGCGVNASSKGDTTAMTAQTMTVAGKTVAAKEGERTTLEVVDWNDSTKERRGAFHKKFMEKDSDVTTEYTVLTSDQFKGTVISAIRTGSTPDLFPIPPGTKLGSVVNENWFMPMNEYVGEDFLNSFGAGALNEGITTPGGKVYVLPEVANIINTLIFYDKAVPNEAGIDENSLPKTWNEFREVCKQMTGVGGGKFHGMIDSGAQANRLELELRSLAGMAGGKCSDISQIIMVDGENTLNPEVMMKTFDFSDMFVKDGNTHPDSVTLKAPEARALFAQNQAAFLIQGARCIFTQRKDNPDPNFGVMAMSVPDDGAKDKLPYVGAQPWMGISANCIRPSVAAKYLKALYSEGYQAGLVGNGGFVSVIDPVNQTAVTDDTTLEYYKLNQEAAAFALDPTMAEPETALVYDEVSATSLGMSGIAQGVLAQSVDCKAELTTLAEGTREERMRAIDAVKASGVDVSAEDFEFKDWGAMKNYTADMYENRQADAGKRPQIKN